MSADFRKGVIFFILSLMALFCTSSFVLQEKDDFGYKVCLETFKKNLIITSMSYVMRKEERIGNIMKVQVAFSKVNRTPYKVYSRQKYPNDGLEVLFVENTNGNKILVNPNGFPWMNVHLDPMGETARKDQHHTIKDSGFDLFISILDHLFKKYGNQTESMVSYTGDVVYDEVKCHKIVFTNPNFKYFTYRAKANENLLTIANKYKVSEYMILEKNPHIEDYYDVQEGTTLTIPNDYSPKMELLIDADRHIPMSIKVFDDKGLFEHYKYSEVKLNPVFTDKDFDKNNPEYGF